MRNDPKSPAGEPQVRARNPSTVLVSDGKQFAQALSNAKPGQSIVLGDGVYRAPSGQFLATVAGTNIHAKNDHKARLVSDLALRGRDQVVSGILFDGSSVQLGADRVRFTSNKILGSPKTAVSISSGIDVRVDYNELSGMRGKGISIGPDPRNPQALVRPHIDHNYLHDFMVERGKGTHEVIQIGQTLSHSDVSLQAVVESNLLENVNLQHSAISVKSSDNIIRGNTLLDSDGGIVNRHGERNRLAGNWLERSLGMWIRDEDTVVSGNKIVGSGGIGLRVMAGTVGPNSREKGYPVAANTTLIGNDVDRLIIGFGWRSAKLPALNTLIKGRQGADPEVTKLARGTVRVQGDVGIPEAIRLARSDVGPDAKPDQPNWAGEDAQRGGLRQVSAHSNPVSSRRTVAGHNSLRLATKEWDEEKNSGRSRWVASSRQLGLDRLAHAAASFAPREMHSLRSADRTFGKHDLSLASDFGAHRRWKNQA